MFQRVVLPCCAVLAVLVMAGCAAIIHGSKQDVDFQTTPPGARVEVVDAVGMNFGSCETPCTLELKRKNQYKVRITKPGYEAVDLVIDRKSSGWIWGNLLFGGVIGIIVDFTTGAAYKLSPEDFTVTLPQTSQGILPGESGEAVVLIDYDILSPEEQANVAQLESIPWPSKHE